MKTKLKPSTQLAPVPAVAVSCKGAGEDSKPNIITIAWAGTICSDPPMVSISVRKNRFSHAIIAETREFVINLVGQKLCKAVDFCGVKSGRDIDKFASCGLNPVLVEELEYAVAIDESPLYMPCKVTQILNLGSHDLFLAQIMGVYADEALFDETGRLCLERAELVAYAHGDYYNLGKKLGFFGYSVASKKALSNRKRNTKA